LGKKWLYVYDCSAPAFSHKFPPPLLLAEKEEVPEFEQEELDELESDLQDYHRRRGVTDQVAWWPSFEGGSNPQGNMHP
jgi:hypothetical protein